MEAENLQNLVAQRLVLGSILKNPLSAMQVCRVMRVSKAWFIYPLDGFYELIETLYETGSTISLPILTQHFMGDDVLTAELDRCLNCAGSIPDMTDALSLLRNNYGYRWFMAELESGLATIDPAQPFDEFFDAFRSKIVSFSLTPEISRDPKQILAEIERRLDNSKATGTWGIPSRWHAVNRKISGYEAGKTTMLAGRPKSGKTKYALNEVRHTAETVGPVDVYSLEMTEDECRIALACDHAELDFFEAKRGNWKEGERAKFKASWEHVSRLPIWISDKSMSGEQLVGSMRDRSAKIKPVFRVVDHMGLLKSRRRAESRQTEVGHMSQLICNAGKDTGCPTLVLCHLNRLADRERPLISHLRESGALEGDAYLVLLLYQKNAGDGHLDEVATELDVAAHRGGPTGIVHLIYLKTKSRFVTEK